MDSIFQLDQTDELFQFQFQLYTTEEQVQQPPSTSTTTHDGNHNKPSSFGSLRRKPSSSLSFNGFDSNPSGLEKIMRKKMVHRDVERERRQEMSTLYASLRSLLPVEYLKGKRSTSDHMHQAVNYIRNLEKRIEELNNNRDELQKLFNPCSHKTGTVMENNSKASEQYVVTVRPCLVGTEVVISTALEEGLPLSRVLQALIREGLRIINCHTTKVKGRLFHIIESEVIDSERRIDQTELQQKPDKLNRSISY